jgi:hypothetical protein
MDRRINKISLREKVHNRIYGSVSEQVWMPCSYFFHERVWSNCHARIDLKIKLFSQNYFEWILEDNMLGKISSENNSQSF